MDDPEIDLVTKQQRALDLAREYLGVENAHIQRRDLDEATDEVLISVGDDPDLLPTGTRLDRATTYCRRTIESESPIALSNVPEQGWADDPAYKHHGFSCYLGTTIFTRGEVYGTVCFISRDARSTDFTTDEKALVELVARLLGRQIEATQYEQQIAVREQAKQRTAGKYEALLQMAPDAVFLADATSGELIEINEQAVELTGYERTELAGMSVLDLHPSEHRKQYARLLEEDFTGTTTYAQFDDGTPLVIRRADGSDIPIEMSVNRIKIDDDTLVQGIVRDISARREREQELERTKDFLQQTQEAVDLGGWEFDLQSETLRWTDEVYRIHGVPLEYEPTLAEALDFYHPADRSTITDAFDQLKTEGEPYDLELRIVTSDGDTRWVRAIGRPQYNDDGEELTTLRGVFRDITERKEREQDLRVRSQAIEESPVGITIGDATQPDIPIVYANEGFTRLTGYPKERVIGENCRFLQGEDTADATTAAIRDAIEDETAIRTEILNYRANGTPFWNKLTVAPVTGEGSDEVTHFVGIQEDITAQKRRDRLIEVLDRVLRHNLRNDMNVVGGMAGVIADRTDGELARLASRIAETATDLTELSEKARSFERAVSDVDSLGRRDIVEDVRAVVSELQREYPAVEFEIEACEQAEIFATEQVRIALKELGENAAAHGQGSPVTYTVEVSDSGEVVVAVADPGPGLPEAERGVLAAGRETPLEHGSGLGLWLVNWVVTGFGGDVTTSVDEGTTVTMRFPPATEEEEAGLWPEERHQEATLR